MKGKYENNSDSNFKVERIKTKGNKYETSNRLKENFLLT